MDLFCSECGLLMVEPNRFRTEWTHRDGSPECTDAFPIPCVPPSVSVFVLREA